jgi:ribosomal protein S18 acetylase RimI-like enzyme
MQQVDDATELKPPGSLDTSQIDLLATVFSRAFHNNPNFVYMIPDEGTRRTLSPWFFRSAIRASQLYGKIYTTDTIDGGALWFNPEQHLTFEQMVRRGMVEMPFDLEWPMLKRCMKLGASADNVRKRLAVGSHWYLMALAVEPTDRGDAIGGVLIEPILSRADSGGLPCYLETFDARDLPFYKRHGFRITGAGSISGGGPNFWAMMRVPAKSHRNDNI